MIDEALKLNGDLFVLTGDYVHRTAKAIEPGIGILGRLKAKYGVVAVLGNHDHWEDAEACRAQFNQIRVPLIDNTRVFLTRQGLTLDPASRSALCVGGIGDLWTDHTDFEAALGALPSDMPRLLLSHNPDTAELSTAPVRIDLMLSGHTHGGQVWLPVIGTPIVPSRYGAKYIGGLCQGPRYPVLVTRGVGMALLPIRFCVPPEISKITLTCA